MYDYEPKDHETSQRRRTMIKDISSLSQGRR